MFYHFHKYVTLKPVFTNKNIHESDLKTVNRILAGNDYSGYWMGIMKLEDSPICDLCGVNNDSSHIILECVKHQHEKVKYLMQTEDDAWSYEQPLKPRWDWYAMKTVWSLGVILVFSRWVHWTILQSTLFSFQTIQILIFIIENGWNWVWEFSWSIESSIVSC